MNERRKNMAWSGQNMFGTQNKDENPFFQVSRALRPANRSLLYSPGMAGLQVLLFKEREASIRFYLRIQNLPEQTLSPLSPT